MAGPVCAEHDGERFAGGALSQCRTSPLPLKPIVRSADFMYDPIPENDIGLSE